MADEKQAHFEVEKKAMEIIQNLMPDKSPKKYLGKIATYRYFCSSSLKYQFCK